jgi:glutaredoxin
MPCYVIKAWHKISFMNTKLPLSRQNITQIAIKFIATQAVFMLAAGHLYAQQIYKSIDKNGRVTYSEIPPTPGSENKLTGESVQNAALPYALQQVVNRYPVTLYTATDCAPCISARLMLTQRGVPFTERTISSNEDVAAYKKINNDNNFPLATIATQQLKGYEETEWTKYLDAAGYPKTSTLPRNYRHAEATPLTQKKNVEQLEKDVAAKPVRNTKPAMPQETSNNPAGIKF